MIYCKGERCSVRNQCLRYTQRENRNCIGGYTEIKMCLNQKRFLQDSDNVVKGR